MVGRRPAGWRRRGVVSCTTAGGREEAVYAIGRVAVDFATGGVVVVRAVVTVGVVPLDIYVLAPAVAVVSAVAEAGGRVAGAEAVGGEVELVVGVGGGGG